MCLRADYPPQEVVCRVSSHLTMAGLRAECGKQLGLSAALSQYSMRVVNFGADVLPLGIKGEHQLISEAGVQHRSTIFLSAPASLKPMKPKPKKKAAKGKGEDKEDEKDRYAGPCSPSLRRSLKTLIRCDHVRDRFVSGQDTRHFAIRHTQTGRAKDRARILRFVALPSLPLICLHVSCCRVCL